MIKIQNNTPVREALPAFLEGLAPESLADLSWTDPALGVQDLAWWPEQDNSAPLGPLQTYGAETLTIGDGVVHVTRAVVPMPPEQVASIKRPQILAALAALDTKSIRALREGNTQRIAELEAQAVALRTELAGL